MNLIKLEPHEEFLVQELLSGYDTIAEYYIYKVEDGDYIIIIRWKESENYYIKPFGNVQSLLIKGFCYRHSLTVNSKKDLSRIIQTITFVELLGSLGGCYDPN